MSNDKRIVFSTDPKDKVEDRKGRSGPSLNALVDINKLTVIFRLEKNGRGGKIVTILSGLPKNEPFLSELTKELKTKCGTGGTFKSLDSMAEIEIQGDQREKIKKILETKGIKFKGM